MSRIFISTLLAISWLLALPPAIFAADEGQAGLFAKLDANGDGQLAASEIEAEHKLLFKRLLRTGDDDGNDRLSAEEFAAALQPVRAEKATIEKQGSRLPGADALVVLMARMDANGDGQLDADEIPADYERAFEQMLAAADGDKSGRIERREFAQGSQKLTAVANQIARRMGLDVAAEMSELPEETMMGTEPMEATSPAWDIFRRTSKLAELFDRLDANGDGVVVSAEAKGPLVERFEEMLDRGDRDQDGAFSKKEFIDVAARLTTFDGAKPSVESIQAAKRQLLKRFDQDRNNALSWEEAPPRIRQYFERSDQNGDGQLRGKELNLVAERVAPMASNAETRNAVGRPAANEDSPAGKSARKLKGKQRAKKNGPVQGNS